MRLPGTSGSDLAAEGIDGKIAACRGCDITDKPFGGLLLTLRVAFAEFLLSIWEFFKWHSSKGCIPDADSDSEFCLFSLLVVIFEDVGRDP